MDERIQEAIARHGNVWTLQTNKEMTELYEPLHAARAEELAKVVKVDKGIKYGEHARHRLDIYQPISNPFKALLPVVVFFHGGGFTAGDNDITPSIHGNIGNYFATNGCIGVLATYRLLPEARYPSGGQDLAQALQWVQQHIGGRGGDPSRITAVGQSAGAAHLASSIYGGYMGAVGVKIDSAVLLSAPMSYDLTQERRRNNMMLYYGTDRDEEILAKAGVSEFRGMDDVEEPRLLVMVAELDSNEIVDGNLMFVNAYRKRYNRLPLFEVMKGHNHISNTLAIGLPNDAVGKRILAFVKDSKQ